jgi:hypothetical protein
VSSDLVVVQLLAVLPISSELKDLANLLQELPRSWALS